MLDQLVDPEAFLAKVRALYDSDKEDNDVVLFKDGRVFERYSRPLMLEGPMMGRVWSFRDITERMMAGEALKKSEVRFQELFNDAPVGYFEYDVEGCIIDANRTELGMLGYTLEEMIGQPVWKFIVEEEVARQQILEKLAGTMPPGQGVERTYRRKDGTTLPVLIEDRILPDSEGRIKGIRTTIQDISGLKRA